MHIGEALTALGFAGFVLTLHWAGDGVGIWAMAPSLALVGLGMGLAMAPFFDIVLAGVEDHESGSASGVLTSVQQLGGAFGIAVLGYDVLPRARRQRRHHPGRRVPRRGRHLDVARRRPDRARVRAHLPAPDAGARGRGRSRWLRLPVVRIGVRGPRLWCRARTSAGRNGSAALAVLLLAGRGLGGKGSSPSRPARPRAIWLPRPGRLRCRVRRAGTDGPDQLELGAGSRGGPAVPRRGHVRHRRLRGLAGRCHCSAPGPDPGHCYCRRKLGELAARCCPVPGRLRGSRRTAAGRTVAGRPRRGWPGSGSRRRGSPGWRSAEQGV